MSHQNTENVAPKFGDVRVRPAEGADLQPVVALDAENTGISKLAYWKDRFDWYAGRHPERFFLVAERGGDLLGFIVGEVRAWEFGSPPSGWIFAVHVSSKARLHGLGTMLYDAICVRFRKAGVHHVRTMVAKDAQLLLSFFRSLGMIAGPFVQLEKRLDP
ncbi:MAG TPA: GNAT family N-acetyltransferase [Anaeromyxobacter sp.]